MYIHRQNRKERKRKAKKIKQNKGKETKRKEKKRKEKKRKEKKGERYVFWRQFNENPSVPSCPGVHIYISMSMCMYLPDGVAW